MSDVSVPAPAVNAWDTEALVAGTLAVLRLRNDDVDEPRVRSSVTAGTELLDAELDLIEPYDTTALAALEQAAVQVAVQLYDGVGDPVAVTRPIALPFKRRWGVA